jgi:tryptophan synthase beta subunit
VIGDEAKQQFFGLTGKLPDILVAWWAAAAMRWAFPPLL